MVQLIEIQCECGKLLRVPRWRSGQKGKCTSCMWPVLVPSLQHQPLDSAAQNDVNFVPDDTGQVMPGEMVGCPYCGQANPAGSFSCHRCRQPFATEAQGVAASLLQVAPAATEAAVTPRRNRRAKKILLLILLLLPLLLGIVAYFKIPVFHAKVSAYFEALLQKIKTETKSGQKK
jgi:hypothetical protein